jgi:selenocysteine-specific elongation factor
MPRGALRGALPPNVERAVVDLGLSRLEERGAIQGENDLVHVADFVARLSQRNEALAARIRADAMIADLEPATAKEQAEALGVDPAELRELLAHLERDGSLVRAPGDLWFDAGAIDELRERVVAHLNEHGELSTTAYKDLIGTTRKFAVPLMELFDSEHLTIRRGEARVLRRRSGATA